MKKIILTSGFILSFLYCSSVSALEIKGYVRSVNHEGHSFSVDVPPLQRVWVYPSAKFDSESGYAGFKQIQDDDYVSVEGTLHSNGLLVAKKVHLLKRTEMKGKELNVDLNQRFNLEVNQKAKISQENLTVSALEILDNFCQEGLKCGGEGSLSIRLEISKGGKKEEILLSTRGERKPTAPVQVEIFGYKVELIEMGESVAVLAIRK